MRDVRFLALAAGLLLLVQGAARAQANYKLQRIAMLGDTVADVRIPVDDNGFEIGALNDAGHLLYVTDKEGGGQAIILHADGQSILVAAAGKEAPAPIGTWSAGFTPASPLHMNQAGNVVFLAVEGSTPIGQFFWDFKTRQTKPIVLKGMPAVGNLTFEQAGDQVGGSPTINNHNDIAFVAVVKNAAGTPLLATFFLSRDNKLLPVVLPDQDLFGAKAIRTRWPAINDAGAVAIHVRREGDQTDSGYLWENGTISLLVPQGQEAPDGNKLPRIFGLLLNNKNRNVLVGARLNDRTGGPWGLYLLADGKLKPVAVPGQPMPGGGTFKTLPEDLGAFIYGVSRPNDAGQVALIAQLEDDTSALYLMDADGKLSLVLKPGATTDVGKIVNVGTGGGEPSPSAGVALNNKGQIAVTVLPEEGEDILALLTPAAP